MLSARPFVLAGAIALSAGGCKASASLSTGPVAPAGGSQPVEDNTGDDPLAGMPPAKDIEKVEVLFSIEAIDDVMAAGVDLLRRVDPDETTDPLVEAEAMLMAQGFAPAFMKNLDLSGLHAFWVASPVGENGGPGDTNFAGNVAVIDGRKLIEATPQGNRPQPLGDGVWELRMDDNKMLLKEAGKELHVGTNQDDLRRASGLRTEAGSGRRIRARAWNIPVDDIDPADLLDLPADNPIVKQLTGVAKELKAIEVEADFGTERPLQLFASAEAPFEKLGLGPLGKPRRKPRPLEFRLPGNPFFVTSLSFGKAKLLHKSLDNGIPLSDIPAPFDAIVKKAMAGAHTLLSELASDVVLAMYIDAKGQASIVIAADIKDDAKALGGVRELNGSIEEALKSHAAMQGKNTKAKFVVEMKPGGIKVGGVKADRMLVKIPKDFQEDAKAGSIFLKGQSLEMVSFVSGKTAVVAIGAGGRTIAGKIAASLGKKKGKDSLGDDPALLTLRKTMEGCQVCVAFDAKEYLRMRLLLLKSGDDKAVAKTAKANLAKLKKVSGGVDVSAGLRLQKGKGAMSVVVPAGTLALSSESMKTLRSINEFVDDPGTSGKVEVKTK